jgi:ribonucleotide reductase alpha subunit
MNSFCVIKRNGDNEEVSFDKVIRRIKKLCDGLSSELNPIIVAQKVCSQIYNNVSTVELDELAAQTCISMETIHLDYGVLASRIIISNNHKCTSPSFSETIYLLFNNKDKNGKKCPLIANDIYEIIMKNKEKLNACINYEKDYLFDYFGFKTLEKAYLMRSNERVIERVQHLFMRVCIGIHKDDLKSVIQSYELMSSKYFTHATPSLYNAGTIKPQFSSCFLLGMDDSVKGIYKAISDCAEISACAGGIGISISKIRSKNSYIKGSNGYSNGIIPLCRVLNETARHINQGGKRPGSIAVYIEPHNVEILEFLELKKNTGAESERARDLFLALWISDLFMKRVEADLDWSLFDASECTGLEIIYGEKFEELYLKYENEGKARKSMKARKIWNYILTSQIETGVPYILYKDNINKKSNQMNIGTITNSNLCVVGETKILTDKGYVMIKDVVDKFINVWNGNEFSKSFVTKTGENQKIIKVILNDGAELECTEYHKFYDENGIVINAVDLKNGTKLMKYDLPIYEDGDDYNEQLFNDGKLLIPFNCSRITKMNWFIDNENKILNSRDKIFLYDCKLLLQTLGYHSIINDDGIHIMHDIIVDGIRTQIEKIVDEKKYADTYCFNEPIKHMGIFNGVYAGNCAEITEYSDSKEYAVCTLASLSLPNFVTDEKEFNFDKLIEVTEVVIRNLNKIIDVTYYPVPETEISNKKHRPLGLGVQGLADVYAKMGFPFDSIDARNLNKMIFETIYYSAMKTSHAIALENEPYSTFRGSPLSKGLFQFDLWNVTPSSRYDWNSLREEVMRDGVANSLLIALMPTASTSQILGNNECFEPYTSNIYSRRTIAGDFIVINKYLVKDLMKAGLWNIDIKNMIVSNNGSIQSIDIIPQNIKDLYKTVWEIKQKVLIDQAIDRGPFICQTQSMNLFFEEPSHTVLTSAFFHGWKNGLKTGCYYIRTKPKAQAQKFTIEPTKENKSENLVCNTNNYEACEMCSA